MLYNLPIEDLVDRYSYIWNRTVPDQFRRLGVELVTVEAQERFPNVVTQGQFLNVYDTLLFKGQQLGKLLQLAKHGQLVNGDVVFVHDLWYPGLEALFYLRDALGIGFKVCGMLHAGSYDPHDMLAQKGMARWARDLENCWMRELDAVYVATNFHRELLLDTRHAVGPKVHVTGFPAAWPETLAGHGERVKKEKLVVFPHRLAPEKDPDMFWRVAGRLAPNFPNWKFVCTQATCKDKGDYYHTLARASVSVSCAKQETWGIAMQESVIAGCVPVVPDRLSYSEMYGTEFRYEPDSDKDLASTLEWAMDWAKAVQANPTVLGIKNLQRGIFDQCSLAVPAMVANMRDQGWNV